MNRRLVLRVIGIVAAVTVIVAIAAVVIIAAIIWLTRDYKQDLDLGGLGGSGQIPGFSNFQVDTATVCADLDGCLQGARSQEAEYRRFDTPENAAAFAGSTRDSYQSEWIVIQYLDSAMTPYERDFLQGYIDGLGSSD